MKSDTPLDYAIFQLSPKRSRCELFVAGEGKTEKLASGLVKPFVSHLKVAEEQIAQAVQSIKLDVDKQKDVGKWFTKGTLERFVRFVSTPEVLELVITFDAEMSQLEAARRIYSQGVSGDHPSGENETAAADLTKKELLRAIDVRLVTVEQDLSAACTRALAAGFTLDNVSELLLFADRFGAHRLKDACSKFIYLCQHQPKLVNPWKGINDQAIRSSSDSDMSIDEPTEGMSFLKSIEAQKQLQHSYHHNQEQDTTHVSDLTKPAISQPKLSSSASFPMRSSLRESSSEGRENKEAANKDAEKEVDLPLPLSTQQPTRRLSVQDRINMFENKQKEQSGIVGSISKNAVGGKVAELRRLSSDISLSSAGGSAVVEKAVLRRWSGASDMSVESSSGRKEHENCESTVTSSSSLNSENQKDAGILKNTTSQLKSFSEKDLDALKASQFRSISDRSVDDAGLQEQATSRMKSEVFPVKADNGGVKDRKVSDIQLRTSTGMTVDVDSNDHMAAATQIQSRVSFKGAEHVGLKDQRSSQTKFGAPLSRAEHTGSVDLLASSKQSSTSSTSGEDVNLKDTVSSHTPLSVLSSKSNDAGLKNHDAPQISVRALPRRIEDVGLKDQLASQTQFGTYPSKALEVRSKSKVSMGSLKAFPGEVEDIEKDQMASQPQHRRLPGMAEEVGKCNSSGSQSQRTTFPGVKVEVGKKQFLSSQAHLGVSFSSKLEESGERDLGLQEMKLNRQSSAPEQNKKLQTNQEQCTFLSVNEESSLSGRKATEAPGTIDLASVNIVEPIQKVRQSKGNQELNEELQVKANELEKLFAAHKLRVPGDQMPSARRSKTINVQVEQHTGAVDKKLGKVSSTQLSHENEVREPSGNFSSVLEPDVALRMKIVDNQDYGNSSKQLSNFSPSEDIRGRLYERYMKKREAKLREEWVSKGAQKEAKMKAMHDSLERSKAEMEAKFSVSADRKNPGLLVRRRAESLRSFRVQLATKNREQQLEEPFQSDEEEDIPSFSEETNYGQDASFNETLSADGSVRSIQSKKPLSNKGLSSTPRTTVALPRSSVKANNSGSGRRRLENPLAHSLPNLSDIRKENTKPSTGISKTVTRSQVRNYMRSKSTSEDISLVKEDKPRRSQSMRKSTASPCELEDPSSINSDCSVLTPLRFSKEQNEQSLDNKIPKNGELKPFLRKGNGIGPGTGAGIAKLKASLVSDNIKCGEESEELADQAEDSSDMVKSEVEEEFERSCEEIFKMGDSPAELDNEKLSQESEKYDPGSENGEVLRSLPQADDNSTAAVVDVLSKFNTSLGTLQDSPGESPASWNSHTYNAFSYAHDASDVDVSADSPTGSPTSWNSHSMTQMMEADAARMRKKWGSAQKPILVANTSHQSRKDVTKGFKRLLKFGRKSKGAESLITDWVSASTTSEGDDDTEDGRDPTNRSSEDLRKTRMGFSQYHPPYDGFNEGEIFNEQVQSLRSSIPAPPVNFKLREDHISGSSLKAPRSFFSLSSFRSKGSESKPR